MTSKVPFATLAISLLVLVGCSNPPPRVLDRQNGFYEVSAYGSSQAEAEDQVIRLAGETAQKYGKPKFSIIKYSNQSAGTTRNSLYGAPENRNYLSVATIVILDSNQNASPSLKSFETEEALKKPPLKKPVETK